MAEVEVAGLVKGHEVNVDVGDIDAHHGFTNLDAGADFFQAFGHSFSEEMELAEEPVVEVEDVVHFLLWNAENMSTDNRVNVEESKAVFGFGDFIAGDFTCDNFAEDGHNLCFCLGF